MDVNQTYSGDHFLKHRNMESICYTPETNMSITPQYKQTGREEGRKKRKGNDEDKAELEIT